LYKVYSILQHTANHKQARNHDEPHLPLIRLAKHSFVSWWGRIPVRPLIEVQSKQHACRRNLLAVHQNLNTLWQSIDSTGSCKNGLSISNDWKGYLQKLIGSSHHLSPLSTYFDLQYWSMPLAHEWQYPLEWAMQQVVFHLIQCPTIRVHEWLQFPPSRH
jgi:hypothetical protein